MRLRVPGQLVPTEHKLMVGSSVVVIEAFLSDREGTRVQVGWTGVVCETDEAGAVSINFAEHGTAIWVSPGDAGKLQVTEGAQDHDFRPRNRDVESRRVVLGAVR